MSFLFQLLSHSFHDSPVFYSFTFRRSIDTHTRCDSVPYYFCMFSKITTDKCKSTGKSRHARRAEQHTLRSLLSVGHRDDAISGRKDSAVIDSLQTRREYGTVCTCARPRHARVCGDRCSSSQQSNAAPMQAARGSLLSNSALRCSQSPVRRGARWCCAHVACPPGYAQSHARRCLSCCSVSLER